MGLGINNTNMANDAARKHALGKHTTVRLKRDSDGATMTINNTPDDIAYWLEQGYSVVPNAAKGSI